MNARCAVFGQPIAHSLSPRIHAAFAAQVGIALDYRAIEAGCDDFTAALDAFARAGGSGANVTLPLKELAFSLCVARSERAQRCGSVNTLIRDGNAWRGDSTDGVGLLNDLRARHGFEAQGRRILLLGAGGAARAAAFALADAGAHDIAITNRSVERAAALAGAIGTRARAFPWIGLASETGFDLVINATAAGHAGTPLDLPPTLTGNDPLCYDLSYGAAARSFLDSMRAAGATRCSDGLGMLVEQAAESFALWHGVRPRTSAVYDDLRAQADKGA